MALEGRSDDAAALLGGLSGSARERCRREVDLALVLAFGLNRSRDGAERLELLLDDVDDDQWGYVAGQIPLMWLLAGEIHEARRAAEDVLADARSSGADRLSAELVLIPALNLLGLPVSALDRATGVLPRVADHGVQRVHGRPAGDGGADGHRYAGDLDMAEQVGLQMYERVTQGAALLRGVYALRLGQIALWRGAGAGRAVVPGGRGGPGGDALTCASAVDHVRYTRAPTGRSEMPSALAPGALYAVEHDYLSSAVEAAAGDVPTPGPRPRGASRRGSAPATSPTRSSPSTRPPATAGAGGRRAARRATGDGGTVAAGARRRGRGAGPALGRAPRGGGRLPGGAGPPPPRRRADRAGRHGGGRRGAGDGGGRAVTRLHQLAERCDGATTEPCGARAGPG